MPRNRSRFQPGSAVYTCHVCHKQTRETGEGESQLDLCAYCFLIASWGNSLTDEAITQEEFDAIKAKLDKQYGRTS